MTNHPEPNFPKRTSVKAALDSPPIWRTEAPRTLRGAKEAADYLGWDVRRVFRDCELGRLPHWTEGKGQLRFNTAVLDLHRCLPQIFVMVGRDYGPEEVAKCLPLFTLAMQGVRPTQDDILKVLAKAGVFPAAALAS